MKVQMLVNHFIISDDAGHSTRVNFSDLTPEQEAELRAAANAQRQPRNVKRSKRNKSRAGGQASRKVNYAELVCGRGAAGVNGNKLPPFCDYCHTNHYGYQDHYLG